MSKFIALVTTIFLSLITVLADYFIKKASFERNLVNKWLILGAIIYGLTAFGWVFVMKNMKLSTLGALYGISCITILTIISIFIFHEKISTVEIIGILFGIISIIILYKFA
jgi:small multidrug resistance pump